MENTTENAIRDRSDEEKASPQLMMTTGRTTFLISLHYAEDGSETLDDKVKRLITKDVQTGNF